MQRLRNGIFLLTLLVAACSAKSEGSLGVVEASTTDELQERQAIFDRVKRAIETKDFATLNAMESEFRTRRSLTPSGTWKLSSYYAGLRAYLNKGKVNGRCVYRAESFLGAWADLAPDAPGAYIVEAMLLLDNAWCHRGGGYARTVRESAWVPYEAGVAAAYQALEEHRAVASVDPEFYSVMAEIYIAQGQDESSFANLLEEATDKEPYYYNTYFKAFRYYLPQWNGSFEEVEKFARSAADQTSSKSDMGTYARVFWYVAECDCDTSFRSMHWPTMKKAMQDVVEQYPNDWNAANFARISCRKADAAEAAKYFAMLKKDDGVAWTDKFEWHQCQKYAKFGG